MPNSAILFDLLTRQQVLLDSVGQWFVEWSNSQYSQLMQNIKASLNSLNYDNLDGLSKVKLNAIILHLRNIQLTHYDKYTEQLLKMLISFSSVHLSVVRRTQVSAYKLYIGADNVQVSDSEASEFISGENSDNSLYPIPLLTGKDAGDLDSGLLKTILAAASPASGLSILQMLKNIKTNSISNVENTIRQAWANRKSINDLIAELTGAKSDITGNNVILKSANSAKGAIFTFVQQVAQSITSGIQSALYKKYVWVSILDSRTSAICRSLNGKIFIFGQGPVPPAHFHCRSHTVALQGDDDTSPYDDNQSFADWLATQPNSVKKAMHLAQASSTSIDEYGDYDSMLLEQ